MPLISTPSFRLAVAEYGDRNASRLALLLPGKLDTKDYPHMVRHAELLADLGYLSLSFDPPGSWESEGDIATYTITNYIQAVHEIIALYGQRPTVLCGHSMGGSVAVLAAADNPHITHVVASMFPVSLSKIDAAWQAAGIRTSTRDMPAPESETQKAFQVPYSFVEDSQKHDVLNAITRIGVPKLFVIGEHDTTVPAAGIEKAFQLASDPKWLRRIDAEHNYRNSPSQIAECSRLIGEFLGAH